jgi:DNA modification methylase
MNETLVKKFNKILYLETLEETMGNPQVMTDSEYEGLKESIRDKGFLLDDPVVWEYAPDKYRIISGHHRIRASIDVGIKELNCKVLEGINQETADLLTIEANRRRGHLDDKLLNEYITHIQSEYNIPFETIAHQTGIEDLESIMALSRIDEDDEDDVPSLEKENVVSRRGDLFMLKGHRVLCGDALDDSDIARLMNGSKSTMVFTDPPYNIDYNELNKRINAIANKRRVRENDMINDSMSDDEWEEFNKKLVEIFKANNIGDIYVWGSSLEPGMRQRLVFVDSGIHLSSVIIWSKNTLSLTRSKYKRSYDPCFYGWFGKSSFRGDYKQLEVWQFNKPIKSEEHPTMKPIKLCEMGITNSSDYGDIVLDIFLGSGSTLVACELTGRKCYGMEIMPMYVDVIVKRFLRYTNSVADCFIIRDDQKIPLADFWPGWGSKP